MPTVTQRKRPAGRVYAASGQFSRVVLQAVLIRTEPRQEPTGRRRAMRPARRPEATPALCPADTSPVSWAGGMNTRCGAVPVPVNGNVAVTVPEPVRFLPRAVSCARYRRP